MEFTYFLLSLKTSLDAVHLHISEEGSGEVLHTCKDPEIKSLAGTGDRSSIVEEVLVEEVFDVFG